MPTPLVPDDDLLRALGSLVVSFSVLEDSLHSGIANVIPVNGGMAAQILSAGLSFSVLVDKFGALYYELFPEIREQVAALCSELSRLNEERNALIHSLWVFESDTGNAQRHRMKARATHGLTYRSVGVASSEVRSLVAQIEAIDDKLWEIILDRDPPSPLQVSAG